MDTKKQLKYSWFLILTNMFFNSWFLVIKLMMKKKWEHCRPPRQVKTKLM